MVQNRFMPESTPPSRWPAGLKYLRRPEISKAIEHDILKALAPRGTFSATAVSATRIRLIEDVAHPACGQNGLFAIRKLSPGAHIVDYMGYYHLPLPFDTDEESDYDLSLRHGALHLAIDAARMGNEARMINDYRGIAADANACFDSYVNPKSGEIRMGVFVKRQGVNGGKGIKKGEEILLSYGKGFWSHRLQGKTS